MDYGVARYLALRGVLGRRPTLEHEIDFIDEVAQSISSGYRLMRYESVKSILARKC